MALKDWGPLSAAKKQSEISAAFEAIKNGIDITKTDVLKERIYNELKKTYKLNQAKFSTWQKFWANANYEKHLQYLQSLVDMENEERAYTASVSTYSKSGNSGSGSGNGGADGSGSESGMSIWLIVAVVAVVVILLIKKLKKK